VDIQKTFKIETQGTIQPLRGYFNSWSGVQNYKEKNKGADPVEKPISTIAPKWTKGPQQLAFPSFCEWEQQLGHDD
jgi:hypothetical protein